MDNVKMGFSIAMRAKVRGKQASLLRLAPTRLRQDRQHLLLGGFQRLRQRLTAPGFQQPNRSDQRLGLFGGQHQRRQIVARQQPVAAARFALHRYAGEGEIANIAIDGTLRHAQPLRQQRGGSEPPAAQDLHNLK